MIEARLVSCSKRHLQFKDLQAGDIFFGEYGELFIAIEPFECYDADFNAVCLSNGELVMIDNRDEVRKFNKPLVFDYTLDDIVDTIRN